MPLIESLATTPALAEVFSDDSVLAAMLQFEVALARVQARLGIVPQRAADAIASAVTPKDFDPTQLSQQALNNGTLSIPFVKELTARVRIKDVNAAGCVHWGATSQDLADTALVLLLKRAKPVLDRDLDRLALALRQLSETQKETVMLGRTLLQAAPPITFGLKAAGWLAAVERCHARLRASFRDALVLQFGGASGTLAALGSRGMEIARGLGDELELDLPDAPWHAQRDRLAALVSHCGVLAGSLGKMARDISLLMQVEIGEVSEPSREGRGGSSTMPHKQNPVGCAVTLAAASRIPGLVASYLSAMVQEHERAVGGWQSEWRTLADVVQATGLAAACMSEVTEGMTVNAARMRANVDATRGAIFAEKAMMLLAPALGRDAAHRILEEASRRSISQQRHLAEVLVEIPEVTRHLDANVLSKLEMPEDYLGSAEAFRQRLLASPASSTSDNKKD